MIKPSISSRLALMFALTVMVIVSGYALLLHHSLHESLRNQMHKELQFRHSLIAPYLTSLTTPKDWQMIQNKFNNLIQVEGGKAKYWILSEDKRYSIGSPLPGGVNWAQLKSGFNKMPDNEDARSFYLLITDIPARGERPALRSAVAIDSTPYLGTLNEFTRVLVIITILGVLIVAVLGFVIARIGMRPVNHLSQQAHTLAPGDHSRRLDTAALPVELQKLATSFNGVLERQEVAWKQLDSFNADVAHELRTPLTNLIGQTQLGLSRERNIHEWEDLLQSNLEELERMTSIVNDMLFLSHAQAGQFAKQLTEVSLREETLKTAEYVEPSFAEKALTLRIEGDLLAQVDRRLFHRSLANLLENSARHAPTASEIKVTIEKRGKYARIVVANVGESIEDKHLVRLFERFYRVDASRTRSDMHHGLGLSIVRAVALMHHGDVFANSIDGINKFGFTMIIDPLD
uniref:heavy metal sensor histidine kinase n=1 Tax=Yersinia aleksiciae TaxID=263819 RepID=UPI0011A707DD